MTPVDLYMPMNTVGSVHPVAHFELGRSIVSTVWGFPAPLKREGLWEYAHIEVAV